jgi:putative effector of murein hydrolase LrgA (UPF0299 family)
MIRIIFAFLIVFGLFFFGIKAFRDLTKKDKWTLTKYLAYSTICAMLTTAFLVTIVILF